MKGKNKILFVFLLGCIVFSISGCDPDRYYEKNFPINNNSWDRDNKLTFDVPIDDSTAAFDVYINIRHTGEYKNSNLYIFLTTTGPNNLRLIDTVDCVLANDRGKWFGRGIGDLFDNQILYKKNVGFPYAGTYTFIFEQAMREKLLKDVTDVGIRIEKKSKK